MDSSLNYTSLNLPQKKGQLKNVFKVTLASAISGALLIPLVTLFGKIVLLSGYDFPGFLGLALAFLAREIIRILGFLFTGLVFIFLTWRLKIRPFFLPTLFSSFILYTLLHLVRSFSQTQLQTYSLWILTYILVYNFFYLLFSIKRFKFLIALFSLILSTLSFIFLPRLGLKRIDEAFFKKENEKLAKVDIDIYAPRASGGRFNFEGYGFNYYSEPPYVTLDYSLGLVANEYKTPFYFDPPKNCGQDTPQKKEFYHGVNFECKLETTTPRGRPIWAYSQEYDVNPNATAENFFTKIGDTVISFSYMPVNFKTEEIVALVDALEPVTVEELKKLSEKARTEEKNKKAGAAKYVKFKTYMPKYLPRKYKIKKILLGNPRDPTNPDLLLILNNEARMYQFKSKLDFAPPGNCGNDSAEFETQFKFGFYCKLYLTTPRGIKVYSYLNPTPEKAIFFIDETKFSLLRIDDKEVLIKIIDSLEETPLEQIKDETYK